jgi:hypothetical protein
MEIPPTRTRAARINKNQSATFAMEPIPKIKTKSNNSNKIPMASTPTCPESGNYLNYVVPVQGIEP